MIAKQPEKKRLKVEVGAKLGRLVILSRAESRESGGKLRPYWLCACDCGIKKEIIGYSLASGDAVSCGCFSKERAKTLNPPRHHNATRKNGITAEYRAWAKAKARCRNPNDRAFRYYGARGIKFSDEWANSFESFLKHIGQRPSAKHSIDRINNDGNYEPGNVRWATSIEQNRNRRALGTA